MPAWSQEILELMLWSRIRSELWAQNYLVKPWGDGGQVRKASVAVQAPAG